jgi:hypothetical protein
MPIPCFPTLKQPESIIQDAAKKREAYASLFLLSFIFLLDARPHRA